MKATLMSRPRILIAALLGFAGLAATPVFAALFTLEPSADAFVTTGPFGNLRANNYGGAGALGVSAPGHSAGEFQSVLRFNFAGARSSFDSQFGAGQWVVQAVQLQLAEATPGNSTFNANSAGQFHISWMQSDSWLEGTGRPSLPTTDGVTFSTLPGFISAQDQDLGTFSFPGGSGITARYLLGLGSGLTAEILAGADADLRTYADAGNGVSFLFHSRSYIRDTSAHPLLTISAVAVPEPGTAALIAVGGAILFSFRGRRLKG